MVKFGGRRSVVVIAGVTLIPMSLLLGLGVPAFAVPPAPTTAAITLSVRVAGPSVLPGLNLEVLVPSGLPVSETPFTVTMSNLKPFSRVDIYAHSEPVLVATGYADADGNITLTGVLPSLSTGQHTVSVDATTAGNTSFSETVLNLTVTPSGVADPIPLNGALSLSVPAGASAVFLPPTLVNNQSTTLGTLGAITVNDGRVLTREGWNVRASVADFVSDTDFTQTISSRQLGVAPRVVSTDAVGITASASQVAGSAIYPALFASAAAANPVGTTVLNAALTFVAPQEKAAATYRSTLTLTIVSK